MFKASRIQKGLFYLLLLPIVLGIGAWQGWSWWSWASAPPTGNSSGSAAEPDAAKPQTVQIQIPEGSTAQQIGEDLHAAGLIRSLTAWNIWSRWLSQQDRTGGFQAGTYELSSDQSMTAIADQLWRGDVVQSSYTIPEGWSMQQMAKYFEEQGYFSAQAFLDATKQIPRDRYPWLPENLPHLEGFLYPDTYQFGGELTPQLVVDQMLDRFQQVALPLYEKAQGTTKYSLLEWVTLASIVEKEAVIGEERPTIAGVFARRLREGITLGADPTVEYGLGIRQTVDQPLTFEQVRTPSPYNTYINPGLPPTPIASPGVASLEVSLNPPDTEYLYFVARYDGTHVFSRTLAEHEAAQAAIHDGREVNQQPAGQPAAGQPESSPAASPSPTASPTNSPATSP
ncbi:endolytic transglycosylase MltG [Leptolyngbya ohadii]|uniref:endolytic transglycosylase MltG n=1 Tax=Leptolyngbya ohadii TaxID=1962290 RepID=UPI000B59E6E7|nr:endolytic transglycosylase MltG [Leptolyngbya ohadii]